MTAWVPIKRLRCPKCGEAPNALREWWHGSTVFDAMDGHRAEEGWHSTGMPSGRVTAHCKCGHNWRVRGVGVITALDEVPIVEGET